ncbi:MAG TPA: GAF domain-containing protein [Polyangiaceae bacterium]|nr:GAF domain-containing protein [Polyangiaceae bacterium]
MSKGERRTGGPSARIDRKSGLRKTKGHAPTRAQIEARASHSERLLATAQRITHIGSWEWTLSTNTVVWSDELYRIYGLEPQSCVLTFEGFLARVHQDDRAKVTRSVSEAVKHQAAFQYRERILRPDGSIRELDSAGEPRFDDRGRFIGLVGTCRDVTESRARERLEEGVHQTLELIATSAPLAKTLTKLVLAIENEVPRMMASILLYDEVRETLHVGAAPSLPAAFNRELASFPIGPSAGSCGTAVYRRGPVFVSDILTDPLWEQYRYVVERYGLRACWSSPIFSNDGRVLGTFALYYAQPCTVPDAEVALIRRATHIAGIAIERKQMEEQLGALNAHLEYAREEERTGIAREIHDELGQAMTGLKMDVAWLGRRLAAFDGPLAPEVRGRMSGMSELIDETIGQVRRISAELRPGVLDHLGLVAALEWQAKEFEKRMGVACVMRSNVGNIDLARDASTGVFRIFQEALTNVARHAAATRVDVNLEKRGDVLSLVVADNGKGIREGAAKSPTSLGLLGIRERARRLSGDVDVFVGPNGGTTVTLALRLDRSLSGSAP